MNFFKPLTVAICLCLAATNVQSQSLVEEILEAEENPEILLSISDVWLDMPDEEFAKRIAQPLAFGRYSSAKARSLVAWMYFARLVKGAPSDSGHIMEWLTWHTNNETFSPPASEAAPERVHTAVSKAKRASAAGLDLSSSADNECPRNFPPQAVTRNDIGFEYLNQDLKIFSIDALADYLTNKPNNRVDMPVGAIGVKGVFIAKDCIEKLDGTPGTGGPLNYKTQAVWDHVVSSPGTPDFIPMSGLHIMVKLQPTPEDPFVSEQPSWFWATFELNTNPGLDNVWSMITGRDALSPEFIDIFSHFVGDIGDPRLANYRLSGTQSSFTLPGGGNAILGSSKLENFAGGGIKQFPQFKTPETWTAFNASCHACHATASFDPEAKLFFAESTDYNEAFPLVAGNLPPSILNVLVGKGAGKGGYDYQHLDFLWPITFQFLGKE